jgi:hypothetical protein
MTLRQRLGPDARRIHEQVDALLDSEDSIIVLVDGRRAINYARGFGLSPCQLELLADDIERLVRDITRGRTRRGRRSCVADEQPASHRRRDQRSGSDRIGSGRVLRIPSQPSTQKCG